VVVSGHCHPYRASSDLHSVKEDSVDLSVPLHAQLRDALIEQIVSGVWRAGSRIPSERELCKQYNVSRTTARRTLSECVHEGRLYTVVGKGTYVSQRHLEQELRSFTGFSDDLRKRGIVPTSRVLAAENLKAPSSLADKLRLLPQAPVLRLIRVRMASGKPIAIQETYLPEHLCPGLSTRSFARNTGCSWFAATRKSRLLSPQSSKDKRCNLPIRVPFFAHPTQLTSKTIARSSIASRFFMVTCTS